MAITKVAEALAEMGRAGARLDRIDACEAGAGNISVALRHAPGLAEAFPEAEPFDLPVRAASLAGWAVLVTGSGCRLRDIGHDPLAAVGAVEVGPDGRTGTLRHAPGRAWAAPTSEFNSHLAVHDDQVGRRPGLGRHAVVHAQPPYLVALSHIGALAGDSAGLTRRVIRWEPETIVQLPDGLAALVFMVPGSSALQEASVAALRGCRIAVWAKHGVMVRSDAGPLGAVDLVEYAETGARYEYLNMAAGSPSEGLTDAELRAVAEAFGVETTLV
ncbi:MAG: class II aldolase/adducin family protein [Bifidobacteriaceae bacterium]|jgi:rhamnulose-1-phosphate aldolase|nr:class II aldolase/adducin family protein [Bifidobacteriaceae bacterium]